MRFNGTNRRLASVPLHCTHFILEVRLRWVRTCDEISDAGDHIRDILSKLFPFFLIRVKFLVQVSVALYKVTRGIAPR